MSYLGTVLAASAVTLLTIPSAAFADVPTTATRSFVKTEFCQVGDTCTNTVQQNADGTLSGTLAVDSLNEGDFVSKQGFEARFTDTFVVFSRTGEVTFEHSWRIEGSVTEVSLDRPADSDQLARCRLDYGGEGQNFFRGVTVPSTQTISTTLNVGPGKGRHKVTVYTQLSCLVTDLGKSQVKLELTEASLDHMHVTGPSR